MWRVFAAWLASAALALAAADDPLATLRTEHPRLILLDADLEHLRSLVQVNPVARRIHADLVKEADRIMTAPTVEYKLVGQRLDAQSRRCLERIYTLALIYRLDGRRQYLDRALRELRAAADFKDWNPAHFLDTAEMTYAFAIAYDWLYPSLAKEDRAWIRKAIVEKGLSPALAAYESQAWWVNSRFYWNPVSNGGIGIGALAVADEEPQKSRAALRYALESISLALTSYGPDGGWAEGPGYWHEATFYTVSFLAALDSALGGDYSLSAVRGFEKTGRFRIYSTGPTGRIFNYADTRERAEPAPEMFWLARRFGDPVYRWQEQQLLDSAAPGALDLVWYQPDGRTPKQESWPLEAVFRGVEDGFLRSAWDDPQAIFVAVKGGDNKANHGHLDLGAFVLDAGGVRWASDPGPDENNSPESTARPHSNYNRTRTEWHNTVTIDGENQDPRAEATVANHFFSPDLSWVEIDLSRAYRHKLKMFHRRIGITQSQQIFLHDVLQSEQPVEAVWSMLTDADISLNGQTADLKKGGWILAAEILSPRHAVFDVLPAPATQPQGAASLPKRLVVRLGEKVTEMDLRVTLTPYRAGQSKPRVTPRFGN